MFKALVLFLILSVSCQSIWADPIFDHSLRRKPEKQRSLFWMPAASYLLPGLDQWLEKQWSSGAFYSGVAAGGYALALSSYETNAEGEKVRPEISDLDDLPNWSDRQKKYIQGFNLLKISGSLSAYQSFRTAALSHKSKYNFLPQDEGAGDILLAPFEFKYLSRLTTTLPLALISLVVLSHGGSEGHRSLTLGDAGMISSISYGAGTGEEAMFRGWLMPLFYEKMNNRFWSNASTALLFGAAHISEHNPVPWLQTLMGWYLGWVTIRDNWSISESVFIHAWWDVFAFAAVYLNNPNDEKAMLRTPTLQFSF